jgi:hypothetical protein
MITRLKMPTQMKKATPTGTPIWLSAKNAIRQAMKTSVTPLIRRTRDTRDAAAL